MSLTLRQRLVYWIAKILRVDYYTNPQRLNDDPSNVYVWVISDDDRAEFAEFLDKAYIEHKGSSPNALHMVVSGVHEIKEISAEDYKSKIKPWLTQRKQ